MELREIKEKHKLELNQSMNIVDSQRKEQDSKVETLRTNFESEKSQLKDRVNKLEKERMQQKIERKIMSDNKTELEEK